MFFTKNKIKKAVRWLRVFLTVLLLLTAFSAKAQINLVKNSTFNDTLPIPLPPCYHSSIICNLIYDDSVKIMNCYFNYLMDWFNPLSSNFSTPDYHYKTHEVGLALSTTPGHKENYREYIGTKLVNSLNPDKLYKVKMKVRLYTCDSFSINRINILLTPNLLYDSAANDILLNKKPQIEADTTKYYNASYSFEWLYQPQKINEQYLYIGNFYNEHNTKKPNSTNNTQPLHAYYLFKDVYVIELDTNLYVSPVVKKDIIICSGETAQLSFNSGRYWRSYKWFTKQGWVSDKLNAVVSPTQTTTYYLATTDTVYAPNNYLDSVTVVVVNSGINNTTLLNQTLCSGDTVTLGLEPQSGYTYFWQPNTYLTSNTVANPVLTLPWLLPNDTLVYNVTLTNPQGQSCVLKNNLAFKIITQYCPDSLVPSVYIPNVFTPNNDGKNDKLKLSVTNTISLQATIYNRWGINISGFSGINGFWDGTTTSGEPAPNGIYYITVTLYGMDSKMYFYSGYIHLQRE